MGSSLGPVLANVIMTELEKVIIDDLVSTGIIKFYIRYVDDTLVLAKPQDFGLILSKLNSYNKSLNFTIDTFPDNDIHFLDIRIRETETDIYYKPTHTGQYCDFSSQTPWGLKTAWVKALYNRSSKICSTSQKFKSQVKQIKSFMSWNGYPSYIVNSIIKRLKTKKEENIQQTINEENKDENVIKIWVKLPYLGKQGEMIVKSLLKKLKRYMKQNVKFVILYQTKKSAMFCPTKDPVPTDQKSHVIYKIICPGCQKWYIGKTDRCFLTRMKEHGKKIEQPMYQHLQNCTYFIENLQLLSLPTFREDVPETPDIDLQEHILNAVINNSSIICRNFNWSQLSFLEAFYIKKYAPYINNGLKASKELQIFR